MANCYDKDGNSDVIKALFNILIDRYTVKYNTPLEPLSFDSSSFEVIPITLFSVPLLTPVSTSKYPIVQDKFYKEEVNLFDGNCVVLAQWSI